MVSRRNESFYGYASFLERGGTLTFSEWVYLRKKNVRKFLIESIKREGDCIRNSFSSSGILSKMA